MLKPPTYGAKVRTIIGEHLAADAVRKMERWKQTVLGAALPEDRISREELVLEFQSNLDKISALQSENAALKSSLEAERKNRCCGNCRYMDTIFDITGERQCGITKFSVDRESDPCERWQSCRG